jgi:hypothetical protein
MQYKCSRCGVATSSANVMVDSDEYFKKGEVNALVVVCKACTRQLDAQGVGKKLHNLWELAWFDDSVLRLMGSVMADLVDGPPRKKWSKQAVDEFFNIAVSAHPNLVRDPLAIPSS